MPEGGLRTVLILLSGFLLWTCLLLFRPGYLSSPTTLGGLMVAQIILIGIVKYRQIFFTVLLGAFVWAGFDLPYQQSWLQVRWFVLAMGSVTGLAVYMKDRAHHFGLFHLVALFCVLSASVSALVSAYPEESLLKTLSLLLLFVHAASGARVAISPYHPERFFHNLRLGCEVFTYVTAACYFVFRFQVCGNPNSLGAIMGVVVVPMLVWGLCVAETEQKRYRLGLTLVVALLLLMSSLARAGMTASLLSFLLICTGLRRFRLLVKGLASVVVLAIVALAMVPLATQNPIDIESSSAIDTFLHKGKTESGVFQSRQGVWRQTFSFIKENPWFGTGFGTSVTSDGLTKLALVHAHFDSRIMREHGNSYLAIGEWAGLLGVVPFYFLIMLTGSNVWRVFTWMRKTHNPFSPAVPAAAMLAAGLVHATFEDWMFAVGYHLCVFFWCIAFILVDLLPAASTSPASTVLLPLTAPEFRPEACPQ